MKLIMLIFALVLIVACSTQTKEANIEESVAAPEVTGEESTDNTDVSDATDAPAGRYDEEIADLRAKGLQRTSYHYDFYYRVLDTFGNYQTKADYQVFVKGTKTKKVYIEPRKLNLEVFYDSLYLDNDAKTAFATCVKSGVLCSPSYEKVYPAEYETLPFTGIDFLENIPTNAKVVGTRALFGRTGKVIEYETSKGKERLYIDTYFGLPLKHELYKVEGGEEVILEESTFSRLSDATESDVTVPKDYVLVE